MPAWENSPPNKTRAVKMLALAAVLECRLWHDVAIVDERRD
jgi:hypothetical protein